MECFDNTYCDQIKIELIESSTAPLEPEKPTSITTTMGRKIKETSKNGPTLSKYAKKYFQYHNISEEKISRMREFVLKKEDKVAIITNIYRRVQQKVEPLLHPVYHTFASLKGHEEVFGKAYWRDDRHPTLEEIGCDCSCLSEDEWEQLDNDYIKTMRLEPLFGPEIKKLTTDEQYYLAQLLNLDNEEWLSVKEPFFSYITSNGIEWLNRRLDGNRTEELKLPVALFSDIGQWYHFIKDAGVLRVRETEEEFHLESTPEELQMLASFLRRNVNFTPQEVGDLVRKRLKTNNQ